MDMQKALRQQQNEINNYTLYIALARREKDAHNKSVYEDIAAEKKRHYDFWKKKSHLSFIFFEYLLALMMFNNS